MGKSVEGGGFGVCSSRRENVLDSFFKIRLESLLLNVKITHGKLPSSLPPPQSSWICVDRKLLNTFFTNITRQPCILISA